MAFPRSRIVRRKFLLDSHKRLSYTIDVNNKTALLRVAWMFGALRVRPVKIIVQSFIYAAISLASTHADDDPAWFRVPFERGSDSAPVVSVFYDLDYAGVGRKQPHAIITCIWADGHVVWSQDRTKGGAPYFTGRIEPKRLSEFIASLDSKGLFARKVWFSHGVDLPHHDINIFNEQRRLVLTSSSDYAPKDKFPDRITELSDAMPYVRQELERLLPERRTPLPKFDYDLRRLPK